MMAVANAMRAGQVVLGGQAGDGEMLASALREQALAAESDADGARDRLVASLIAVIAAVARHDSMALDRAHAFIEEAREAGRPAWMATGRAIAARIMMRSGMSADVLTTLAMAELDLEAELTGPRKLDPPNGPTGPGAAANNLGVIYFALRLMEPAERHLQAAAEASMQEYGPAFRGQACLDLVNLLGFRLAYAIEKETDGDDTSAADQARGGLSLVDDITAIAAEADWLELTGFCRILQLGCLSVVDLFSVPADARLEVRAILEAAPKGSLLHDPLNYAVLARLNRLAGDTDGVDLAVRLAAENDFGMDGPELAWALREAALLVASADSPALSYAAALRREVRRSRIDLAAALAHRMELIRLERTHVEVGAARERLEQALAEAEAAEAALQEAAERDPLTRLLNRASLFERLTGALKPDEGPVAPVAVAFIDLDGFKKVNDERGHVAGDALLAAVATSLRAAVRESDVLARYGGDEFVCLRVGMRDAADAASWGDRLRTAIEEATLVFDPNMMVSASIGVCTVGDGTPCTPAEAIARADAAMYQAKRQGPGGVCVVPLRG